MTTTVLLLSELQKQLEKVVKSTVDKKVFVGFDGFVDKIKKAVKQRKNFDTIYFSKLDEFAGRIQAATGKSGQIEMVTQKIKLGGNGPIFSNTLGRLGIDTFCVGSLGYPARHEVFKDMSKKSTVISVLNPGESDAIEFDDGKIIFSELSVFEHYNWKYIKDTVDIEEIRKAVGESSLVTFVDWVNLPHASDIWQGVLEDVIKPSGRRDFLFLFDLCDPTKKTTGQIDEVLDLISCFSPYGKVTLGLNENETLKTWASINGIDSNDPVARGKIPPVKEAGDFVYKAMNIDCLLVHPIDRTIVFHQREILELQGRLVTKPKVLTGGGDNLNAGYSVGLLSGFSLPHCMLLGMAASGAYIQNGASPDIKAIKKYIKVWIDELSVRSTSTMGVQSSS